MPTSRERTLKFIAGEPVDRVPFHPIVMRWAAQYAGVKYSDFCRDFRVKCPAVIKSAEDFGMDWVTVLSDPYCEAEAFGLQVEYPENSLPMDRSGHLPDMDAVRALKPYRVEDHRRLMNRVRELAEFRNLTGERFFKVGWVEGPVAEYADLRGVSNAAFDFYDDPEAVHIAMEVITEAALNFITAQVQAGADCIGIGDAFCSQIGPELYREFAFERERRMIDHVHSLGALAKLHICGNTTALIPDMIRTGADIIDIDHLVSSMDPFAPQLGARQVFSGKCDPVTVVQDGNAGTIRQSVEEDSSQAAGRCIVSAG
ncbi:MAG: uroporphyrinogen decarboxylase family protein, partial [Kiritimatiellales bacterium]